MTGSSSSLLNVQQVDPWLQFNPYIVSGYRPRMSLRSAFRSFFQWHNESVNLWTHAAAAVVVIYLIVYPPTADFATAPRNNNAVRFGGLSLHRTGSGVSQLSPTATFRGTCFIFLGIFICSVMYHLLMPCPTSAVGYQRLLHCDVIGVVVSVTGSSWSILHRGNACGSPFSSHAAAMALFVSFIAVLYHVLFTAPTGGAAGRVKAIGMHCALRLAVMLWMELPKVQTQGYHLALHYHVMSYFYILIGGAINALRFPEKPLRHALQGGGRLWNWIGRYVTSGEELDFVWNSHNLWHLFAVLSVTSTLLGCYYDLAEFELAKC